MKKDIDDGIPFGYWLLLGLVFPMIYPFTVWGRLKEKWRERRILANQPEKAWAHCVAVWTEDRGPVHGALVGARMAPSFKHHLAAAWHRYQPTTKPFLLEKLHDPDPICAAYAFKCLIRFPLDQAEIAAQVLARTDVILVLPFGCLAEEKTLGAFISEYFAAET